MTTISVTTPRQLPQSYGLVASFLHALAAFFTRKEGRTAISYWHDAPHIGF